MSYSAKQIDEAVTTVHMNSRRQAKRNLVTDYANGDINFIGDCCFSYSGSVNVNNTDTVLLKFNSGPNFLKVNLVLSSQSSSNDDFWVRVRLNGTNVFFNYFNNTFQTYPYGFAPIPFTIPPFTEFEVAMNNTSSSSPRAWYAQIDGKVYSGAEIVQGAI